VKFHRLMHRAQRLENNRGWRLTLDGPLSLFRQTQRYGLQLALFLPALCHCPSWRLNAEVSWGKPRRLLGFQLDHTFGLSSPTRAKGIWESEEVAC
jgi:predicted nuclease of restriction endonuclease-like RecB superfamily